MEWSCLLAQLRECSCELQTEKQLSEVNDILSQLVKGSMQVENRQQTCRDDIILLNSLLRKLLTSSLPLLPLLPTPYMETLTNALKLSRNMCAGLPSNQKIIVTSGDSTVTLVVNLASQLASHLTSATPAEPCLKGTSSPLVTSESHVTFLKTAIQLLGNVCVGYPEGQTVVWQLCFPAIFQRLIACACVEVADVSCMVIHACTHANDERREQLCNSEGVHLVAKILRHSTSSSHLEWVTILLDSLLSLFPALFECLHKDPQAQISLVDYVTARLDLSSRDSREIDDTSPVLFTEKNFTFLRECFHSNGTYLLSTNSTALKDAMATPPQGFHQVQLCLSVLQLLHNFSQDENWLSVMQSDSRTLEIAMALLSQLAVLDGSSHSGKPLSSLRHAGPSLSVEERHPLFGMKKDLVRFIGNLCYKCPALQNKVREIEGIPVILNQCSIDHRNPYITQWAILAIRNLCEGNPANQAVIAALEQRGVAESVAGLEFGSVIEIGDDGKIKIKPKQTPEKH